jgi:hypothetical protein
MSSLIIASSASRTVNSSVGLLEMSRLVYLLAVFPVQLTALLAVEMSSLLKLLSVLPGQYITPLFV